MSLQQMIVDEFVCIWLEEVMTSWSFAAVVDESLSIIISSAKLNSFSNDFFGLIWLLLAQIWLLLSLLFALLLPKFIFLITWFNADFFSENTAVNKERELCKTRNIFHCFASVGEIFSHSVKKWERREGKRHCISYSTACMKFKVARENTEGLELHQMREKLFPFNFYFLSVKFLQFFISSHFWISHLLPCNVNIYWYDW